MRTPATPTTTTGPAYERRVESDHPAFDGHFPGAPIWPGVMLLAEALEAVLADPALAARVGASPRLANVKFLAPVRPGARLRVVLEPTPNAIRFALHDGDRIAASGSFDAAAPTAA